MQQLLTIDQVAALLALSPVTVKHWSYGRKAAPRNFPAPIKVGRQVRYLVAEIDNWILAKAGQPTAPAASEPVAKVLRGRPRKTSVQATDATPGISR